jgi:hypothetical protein
MPITAFTHIRHRNTIFGSAIHQNDAYPAPQHHLWLSHSSKLCISGTATTFTAQPSIKMMHIRPRNTIYGSAIHQNYAYPAPQHHLWFSHSSK